jgi:glycosyltransferase 2 family protein
MFLKCTWVNIPEKHIIQLYLLGIYYNLFLPGGIGGDGYKIYLLKQKIKIKVFI